MQVQVKSQVIDSKSQVKSQVNAGSCKSSQVTTYSRVSQVKSQPSASHVKSLVFGFNSSQVTHVYCLLCTYTSIYRGNFIILFGLNVFFKGLNWFYYILSKASDLRCQQVIFSKSQVKSQVMDSKSKSSPKSVREVASQVTSHKNSDSSRTQVQVT